MKKKKGCIELDRFEVPYRQYGDSDQTLVCVSGAMQTMAIWRNVVARFSDQFTVVIFDMPGIGKSKILHGPAHVTVDEQIECLRALIKETDRGGDLTLSGSSWGTAIAALYATRFPDDVQHLILCSFGIKPNAALEHLVNRASALFEARDFSGGADLIFEVFGHNISASYKRQIVMQFRALSHDQAESFNEHCSNILKLGRLDEEADLSSIRARTVIVNGAEDPIVDLEDMQLAQSLIPDCELRLMPNVGHFLHFEKPELLDEYAEFLIPERLPAVEAGMSNAACELRRDGTK